MSARLIGIARRDKPRAPMELLARARVSYDAGIEGDCRGRTPDRNLTIIFKDDWEAACRDLGRDLPWVTRRANLLVEHLSGFKHVGAKLKIGSVLLEVTEENPPCRVMDLQAEGLRVALQPDWRGGIACRVLQDGEIALGDIVTLVN